MALNNRYSLVLTNVSVVRDVVTGTVDNGLVSARMQPEASPISARQPSHGRGQIGQETGLRQRDADFGAAALAAARAGRLASCLRVRGQRLVPISASARTQLWRSGLKALKPAMPSLAWQKQPGRLPSASTRG
jgi:hypothetical protein